MGRGRGGEGEWSLGGMATHRGWFMALLEERRKESGNSGEDEVTRDREEESERSEKVSKRGVDQSFIQRGEEGEEGSQCQTGGTAQREGRRTRTA